MGNIDIWVPGRPNSYKEKNIKKPMQDIDLMQYQGLVKRSAKVAFLNARPFSSDVSLEITFQTALELDLIAAIKPVLNGLKGEVFIDDDAVRTLSVHINNQGSVDAVLITVAQERSVAGGQPRKTHSLSRRIHVPATPRVDQPPHSKMGEILTIHDESNERAMTAIRASIGPSIEPLEGEIMVSMKIRTNERKLDLDNVAHLYVAACQGFIFREMTQIKFFYMSFMSTEIFPGDEGIHMSFATYH